MSNNTDKSKKPTKAIKRHRARSLAVQALYQWHMSGASLVVIELEFREDNDFQKLDEAYFSELLHKVPAQISKIDETLSLFLTRSLADMSPIELAVLRMGTYELLERTDVPYRVVINESVNLTKTFGATDGYKYVNGVLDKVAQKVRQQEISKK